MRRTFQKWLLVFVSIAFVVTFVTFFLIFWYSAIKNTRSSFDITLDATMASVDTNYQNQIDTLEESKKDTANRAISASLILEAEATSLKNGTASFMMNRSDAYQFYRLYNEIFDNPEIVTYDELGTIANPIDVVYGEVNPFEDDGQYGKEQKLVMFNHYFTDAVKPIMESLYHIALGVKADALHLIDPGGVINPNTDLTNPQAGGYILGSTSIGYFGYDMYNRTISSSSPNYNQQSVDFMNYIYSTGDDTYAQDILEDSSGVSWQYAGVKMNDLNIGIVQIGTIPEDILIKLERLNTETIMRPISLTANGHVILAELSDYIDEETGEVSKKHIIRGITYDGKDSSPWIGKKIEDFGIPETYFSESWNIDHFRIFSCPNGDSYVTFVRGANPLTSDPSDDYVIVGVIPLMDAFSNEIFSLIALTIGSLFIFIVIFILISLLVKRVVIDGIYRVNAGLKQITAGNLDVTIDVNHNKEFKDLSYGINTTVDALKHFIEEEKNRNAQDLALAKTIQSSSLPSLFPPYPERDEFDIFAKMDTAKEVGGDFYDFFFIDGNRFVFLIADVSGKGIPAALFMMRAKTLIKSLAETRLKSPAQIFIETNNSLCENNDSEMFVTAFMCMIDVRDGSLTYVNAGHNPPIIVKNGKAEYLHAKASFVLGGIKNFKYKEEHLKLEPGDTLYLYTDGVSEATNAKEELYGEDRLIKVFENTPYPIHGIDLINDISHSIDEFVDGYEQSDDITQVSFTYLASKSKLTGLNKKILTANDESLMVMNEAVEELLTKRSASAKCIYEVNLVIEEIFANIKNYAYGGKIGNFIFAYGMNENDELHMEFINYGDPFNPLEKEDPDVTLKAKYRNVGGLGIFLVKRLADKVSYKYEDNSNRLSLSKKIETNEK